MSSMQAAIGSIEQGVELLLLPRCSLRVVGSVGSFAANSIRGVVILTTIGTALVLHLQNMKMCQNVPNTSQ